MSELESRRQPRLLLVEDEARLRQSIALALRSHGYALELAGTAAEAVRIAGDGDCALMLLDLNLPDATGWDVLRRLDALHARPPTIVLSAMFPTAQRMHEFAPAAVLQKPFPIDALLRLVRAQLERSEPDQMEHV